MDKHLVFLVKQTERYTSMLTENLRSGGEIGLEFGDTDDIGKKASKELHVSDTEVVTEKIKNSRKRICPLSPKTGTDTDRKSVV